MTHEIKIMLHFFFMSSEVFSQQKNFLFYCIWASELLFDFFFFEIYLLASILEFFSSCCFHHQSCNGRLCIF